jgi:hypothetical protein
MIDVSSFLAIIVIAVLIFLFVKFIVHPLLKLIIGIAIFLILLYIVQNFFGFDLSKYLGPFAPLAKYLDISKWGVNLDWLLNPLNHYLNLGLSFLKNK